MIAKKYVSYKTKFLFWAKKKIKINKHTGARVIQLIWTYIYGFVDFKSHMTDFVLAYQTLIERHGP